VTFDEAGVVDVYCEVHDKMRGAIIVTENPFHALVGEDGSFRIDGVPAGEYTVAFWSADHDAAEETVTVTAGATRRVCSKSCGVWRRRIRKTRRCVTSWPVGWSMR
jgi:hypothetical protein